MKTTVFAILALSILIGIATPAAAFDTKKFYDEQNRWNGGSSGG